MLVVRVSKGVRDSRSRYTTVAGWQRLGVFLPVVSDFRARLIASETEVINFPPERWQKA